MKKYLNNLYNKPDHHKKRFALLASGTITLIIFGFWSLTVFPQTAQEQIAQETTESVAVKEVSPFESIGMNLASSLEALKNSLEELKNGIGSVDIEAEYEKLRESSLNTYGQ